MQGGFTTRDEMCLVFVDYYPKTDTLVGCYGGPTRSSFAEAMGAVLSEEKVTGDAGKFSSVKDYSLAMNWKDDKFFADSSLPRTPKGEMFQNKINNGLYHEGCLLRDSSKSDVSHQFSITYIIK